jgi:hypothetical protein
VVTIIPSVVPSYSWSERAKAHQLLEHLPREHPQHHSIGNQEEKENTRIVKKSTLSSRLPASAGNPALLSLDNSVGVASKTNKAKTKVKLAKKTKIERPRLN